MSFCPSCGVNVGESAFCPCCGYPVNGQSPAYAQSLVQYIVKPATPDAPDKGWFIIGLLCPLAGLIMYLLCHGTRPKRAASAGKGALWSLLVLLIIGFVLMILTLFLFLTMDRPTKEEHIIWPSSAPYHTSTTVWHDPLEERPKIELD